MPEQSFYQHFQIRKVTRFMTKIKEKTYLQFVKKRKQHDTFLLKTPATTVSESSETIRDLKSEPAIENPVLPIICSLPPPPRYNTQHRNKPHLNNNIQTRSSLIATAKKPCLCRSNTLGHPTTPSPLATPDQDHLSPIMPTVVDGFNKEQVPHSLYHPLELHTDILLLRDEQTSADVISPTPSSRTPSLVHSPNSPSSSISRI